MRVTYAGTKCAIDGCDKQPVGRGLCKGHYRRWLEYGDPMAGKFIEQDRIKLFWSKVRKAEGDGCWEWTGCTGHFGYGMFFDRARRNNVGAHKFAFEQANGPVPPGYFVCHRCDNPRCCRPDHLFLGLPADNSQDMASKGRSLKGARHPNSKLTEEMALTIRRRHAAGETNEAIALDLGLHHDHVSKITSGRAWAHLEETTCD